MIFVPGWLDSYTCYLCINDRFKRFISTYMNRASVLCIRQFVLFFFIRLYNCYRNSKANKRNASADQPLPEADLIGNSFSYIPGKYARHHKVQKSPQVLSHVFGWNPFIDWNLKFIMKKKTIPKPINQLCP